MFMRASCLGFERLGPQKLISLLRGDTVKAGPPGVLADTTFRILLILTPLLWPIAGEYLGTERGHEYTLRDPAPSLYELYIEGQTLKRMEARYLITIPSEEWGKHGEV